MKLINEATTPLVHDCPDVQPTTIQRVRGAFNSPTAAVSLRGKYWTNGQTIKVSFENRMKTEGYALIDKVKGHILEVTKHTGLNVAFVATGQGDVRISFTRGGSWSYIGTDAKLISRSNPTMQLGWLDYRSTAQEIRRVVRHEWLHAIGIGHEQAHPSAKIPWDKAAVYAHYKRTQGWDTATVDHNVLRRYDPSKVDMTTYDRDSIMQYPVPNSLTQGDFEIPLNTDLSSTDIAHLKTIYPPAKSPTDKKLEQLKETLAKAIVRRDKRVVRRDQLIDFIAKDNRLIGRLTEQIKELER